MDWAKELHFMQRVAKLPPSRRAHAAAVAAMVFACKFVAAAAAHQLAASDASGSWSTAALSVNRCFLAATSLPNAGLAIFAGGQGTCFVAFV
jgi:hypothetical protein